MGALLSNEGDEFRVDALLIVTIGPREILFHYEEDGDE